MPKCTKVTDALYAGENRTRVKIEDAKKSNENFFYSLNLYGDILFLSLFDVYVWIHYV